MKNLLVILALLIFGAQVYASDNMFVSATEAAKQERHINEVGFRLLNANGINTRARFILSTSKEINAYCTLNSRSIVIYRGLYTRLENDDELAAVLGHEISHSVDSYKGIFRGAFFVVNYVVSPKKYEYKADKRAVDYMVNAGYNPVAMIIVMNKNFPQYRFDWNSSHPLTTRRAMEVYEYIYKKYPEYLANNAYKDNLYYQNFLLTSRENRAKLQQKIETKSTKKVRYK